MSVVSPLIRKLFGRSSRVSVRRRRATDDRRRVAYPQFEPLEQKLALTVTVSGVKWLDSNYNGIRDNDLIQGDSPDIVFVVDVSTTTWTAFSGDPVGDVNGDSLSNNILDASLAGFIALNNQLRNKGVGDRARVAVVAFAKTGELVDMDPSQPGVQTTARPNDDRDKNGTPDIEQVLKGIKVGLDGAGAIDGGSTNYEAALKKATEVFDDLKTPSGVGNLVFLSDGRPNVPSEAAADYADEAKALRDRGYNLRAFGANGAGVTLAPLQVIDPVVGGAKPRPGAAIFNSTNELVGAFAGLRGDSTRYLEPGLAGVTIYIDIDDDGTLDPDEPRAVSRSDDPATVGVDETGWYSITTGIIPPGSNFTIREVVPNGYLNTSLATLVIPNPATPGATIRNQANGSWILNIPDGQTRQNIDFGNAPGAISGLKWLDSNRNGIRDSSLIVGTDPDIVFVIDVSGSTVSTGFGGTIPSTYVPSGNAAGDVNGDGLANTILDAEIAGFMALNQQLIDQGYGSRGRVSVVLFGSTAASADLNPAAGNQQKLVANPTADIDGNGVRDVDQILRSIRSGGITGLVDVNTGTNYEAALTQADVVFATLGTPSGQGNMVFLSDGVPVSPGAHADEVAKLAARGLNLRAFGAGDAASLPQLQIIDKNASIFRTTGELLAAFGNPEGGTPSSTAFSEPGMAGVTIYVDLNNNKIKDAGEPSAVTAADNPATPTVNELGTYTISGLQVGTYTVREVVPAGYVQTGGGNTYNGISDGSWTINIGNQYPARATGIDFGNAPGGVISGVKWRDDNRNGIRDGGLVVGDSPEVMFVIDVSGSTFEPFVGSPVGDVNNDGRSNTILDAELAGFIALNKQLITQFGSNARVGITVFATESLQLSISGDPHYSPVYWVAPNAGMALDNVSDVEDCLRGISINKSYPMPPNGGSFKSIGELTNYEAALQTAVSKLSGPRGQSNLIFLSDGIPGNEKYDDEVATLLARGVNMRAFGAGDGAKLPPLQVIDPKATIFRNTDELLAAFGTLQGGGSGSGSFSEPGMAGVTIYLDLDNDGVKDANEPSTVTAADNPATKNIDETGAYTFSGLAAGKYVVREVVPAGYVLRSTGTLGKFTYESHWNGMGTEQGKPTNNSNNNDDGSWTVYIGWNPVTWTETQYIGSGPGDSSTWYQYYSYRGHAYETSATGIDFGNAPPAEIRGLKWFDRNGDGVRQDFGDDGYNIPSVIFAVDVSGSTWNTYAGCYVGDLNGDGKANTILDAQLAAILDLQDEMIEAGVGDSATISIVAYASTASLLDFERLRGSSRTTVTPLEDSDRDGVSDLVETVQSIREGLSGFVNDDDTYADLGVGTDFEAALQAVVQSAPRGRQLVFFSDGKPTEGGSLADELAALDTFNVAREAFGVGADASLTALQQINPNATVYANCADLRYAIQGYEAAVLPEPGLSRVTVFADTNNNGVLDAGEKSAVTREDDPNTLIDETGTYTISGLTAGTYTVREVVPEGYIQTFPAANGGAHSVTITTAALVKNIDFGNKADPLSPVVTLPQDDVDLVCHEPKFDEQPIDIHATVYDTSSETFAGGELRVSVWSGDASTIDITLPGSMSYGTYWSVRTEGNKVYYHDVVIGTYSGGTAGKPLVVALTARATPQVTQELLKRIKLVGNGAGTYGTRTIKVTVTDDTGHTSIARYRDVSVVPGTVPGEIRELFAKPANEKAELSWDEPKDDGGSEITDYQIRLQEKIGATLTSPTLVTPLWMSSGRAWISGLTNGKSYVFSVRAMNAKGFGPWVTLSTAVTPAPTVPGMVGVNQFGGLGDNTFGQVTAKPGDRQVTLSWPKPEDDGGAVITNYEIQYTVQTGIKWSEPKLVVRAASTATTATVTGLTNGKPHAFAVRAVNANGAGEWSLFLFAAGVATPAAAPGAITALTGTAGNGQASLAWTAPASNGGSLITNYGIQYAEQTGSTWSAWKTVARAASTATTATITGLMNDKAHKFQVRAENAASLGQWVELSPAVTPTATTPGMVTALKATPANAKVTLTWTAPSDNGGSAITNYQIQYAERTNGIWSAYKPVVRAASTATTATITGLTNGNPLLFMVRAENAKGAGTWSERSLVTPNVTVPGTIGGLAAKPGNGQASLTWTAPADNGGSAITNYEIQYADQTGITWSAYKPFARPSSTAANATVTGLSNAKAHLFRVRAVNATGTGEWMTLSAAVTPAAAPGAITALTGKASNGQVALAWTAPASNGGSPITNYQIQYAEQTGSTWSAWKTVARAASTATTATITGLTNGKPHKFQVRAENAASLGQWVELSPAVTPQTTAPATITGLKSTPGNAKVMLTWTAPADNGGSAITNYQIQYSERKAGIWSDYKPVVRAASTATTATITALTNGNPLLFMVRAENAKGPGPWSERSLVTPNVTVPGTIGGLKATPANAKATLTWTAPADNGGAAITNYEIQYAVQTGGVWSAYKTVTRAASAATTATITGLVNGKPHRFMVRAVNAKGAGEWVTLAAAVTPAA